MAELDLTNIANASISTPTAGVTAVFVDSSASPVLLSTKDSSGNLVNYLSPGNTAALTNKTLTLPAGTTSIAPVVFTSGTNLTSAAAGAEEFDGVSFYNTTNTSNGRRIEDDWNFFRLTANGSSISSAIADVFGSNDGIPMVANGIYEIEWHCYFTQSGTGGIYTFTLVSTQTPANICAEYVGSPIGGMATGNAQTAGIVATSSSSVAIGATGTMGAGVNSFFHVHAIIEGSATPGNTRLRLTVGTGSATPLRDSFFKVRQLPAANIGTFVA
jgi:hypothetical protein